MDPRLPNTKTDSTSLIDRFIGFCLNKKIIIFLLVFGVLGAGYYVAPFDWDWKDLPRNPVAVDAIPDIGENQQIVFTKWPGRSPQDVEDQITYPLTVSLMGMPSVKTVRSLSMFGFSSIYIIFEDDVDFYWSRSRILEKLNSLSPQTLPPNVRPTLGPDATGLGQVFWYTLEGHDEQGNPTGGWDLHELRTIQDWFVRYALSGVAGVSEVASVGGFVQEYQVDVDPDAMRAASVRLDEVIAAVKMSNLDVGARTIEINKVEYIIRGLGFVKKPADLEYAVIKVNDNVPIYVKDVAHVTLGPALRRGALDKSGTEAVGAVVVVRYGENPLEVIKNIKRKIEEISPGLPKKTLADGTVSQVKIVPFYDRSGLINETLDTLNSALTEEILVTVIVVLIMILHLRSSLLISALLPLAVLMCFIAMKVFKVDANIVALSGIAIAIGTMVDMGIIVCENIVKHLDQSRPGAKTGEVIYRAVREVGSAVITAVATTIVSFLPVFTMQYSEGKLFKPLAFTKTFALIASIIVALAVIPPVAQLLFAKRSRTRLIALIGYGTLIAAGIAAALLITWWVGLILVLIGLYHFSRQLIPDSWQKIVQYLSTFVIVLAVAIILSRHWLPLGPENGLLRNFIFVAVLIGSLLLFFQLFQHFYVPILRWCLNHKISFMMPPLFIVLLGATVWLGFDRVFWLPKVVRLSPPVTYLAHKFPGLSKEFRPALDEGSFLFMPTTMPHASIGEALDVLQKQDLAIDHLPEVKTVVGKIGRVESSLDPAPVSMIETVVIYQPKYLEDEQSRRRLTFRFDADDTDYFRDEHGELVSAADGEPYKVRGRFERNENGRLIPEKNGQPFRLWRPPLDPDLNPDRPEFKGVEKPNDIWDAIVQAAEIPGTTSAPKLQPIETRLVMLQTGMRANMGVKITGPDQQTIEKFGLEIERHLKQIPAIKPTSVYAERIVGKPYLEIDIDRRAIARFGIKVQSVQQLIETAIGGKVITTTVQGRQRYPVRVRYLRELRDNIESLERILVSAPDGTQIPLGQLTRINFVRGPQAIKSEDTALVSYVFFEGAQGMAEVDVVEQAQDYLNSKIESGLLRLPDGVSYRFAGTYENQIRAEKRLMVILPLTLFIIFMILYLKFSTFSTTMMVFSGIAVAWAGGFIMIWLYGQNWFLDFAVFGTDLREMFQVHTINLSVAVWVGFLALFGIASDDGVVIATFLDQSFAAYKPKSKAAIRLAVIEAGRRRVRPCLMTTATTTLALIPVLTSTGRGSDIMVPMAIPTFGGMTVALITMFVVPVLHCVLDEPRLNNPAQDPN